MKTIINDVLKTGVNYHHTSLMRNMEAELKSGLYKSQASESSVISSLKTYDEAVRKLLEFYEVRNHSDEAIKQLGKTAYRLRRFLLTNSFPYTHEIALEWILAHEPVFSRMQYNTWRRIILSINEIVTTGRLETLTYSSKTPKYQLKDWQSSLLNEYLAYRKQEECAESTIKGVRNACSRFFSYANSKGIESLNDITPELLQRYTIENEHRTHAGKNQYSSQLRMFIRYLGEKGVVSTTLELAISYRYAPNTRIVRVLSDEQTDAIYDYRNNAESPLDLRDSAILLLGLRMGLRRSDIANLKFSDISWTGRTISIAQKKTGVSLKLPIPVDAGNSLYKYIQNGRPNSADCEYIFVRHDAPYCKLTDAGLGTRIKSALQKYSGTQLNGLHITRKTFASNLLKSGNSIPIIASALGHADFSNVNQYLSTDIDQLRKCAIGLTGIEYMGGYGL